MRPKELKKKIIIDRPEALGVVRRKTEWGITTLGWIMWFFLCRPFILIFLWFLGVQIFYEHMVRLGGLKGLKEVFGMYLGTLLAIFLILRFWNFYNFRKFKGKNRRTRSGDTTAAEMERFFKVKEGALKTLQNWSQANVDFAPDNHQRFNHGLEPGPHHIDAYFHPSTKPPHPKN